MPGAVFLEGENIKLRTIEEEDLDFLHREFHNPKIWRHLSISKPQNLSQQREFFEQVISDDEQINLGICREEELMGIVSLIPQTYDENYRVGLWVAEEYHGNGYGTEATKMITNYAFNQLNYHKISYRAHEDNVGSRRVAEKAGYKKEAELESHVYLDGEYKDLIVFRALNDQWRPQ